MTAPSGRVRDRIDSLVENADYRDAESAIEDSWRIALLAASPAAVREREAARARAVDAANARRNSGARAVREATTLHRVMFFVAFLLGAAAVALIAISPRTGGTAFSLQEGAVLAGALALASVGIMFWLEPVRASGSLFGAHLPARYHLFFGLLWLLFAASVPVLRWDEVDRHDPLPVIAGLLMFVAAGAASLVLWRRALRADGAGKQSGVGVVTRGLVDDADAGEVFDALDAWWAAAGPAAWESDRAGLEQARAVVLARLRDTRYITEREERAALRRTTPPAWKERRR